MGAALDRLLRADRGRVLAALIAGLRDFDLAEEALSEAVVSALEHWSRSGMPENPKAWLIRVARRKAIDRLRRAARWADRQGEVAALYDADAGAGEAHDIPDERLRLIFTCCHPALDPKSRVALTLRTLGGLSTAEIARAFLDSEAAMGQRLTRAKAKIAAAGIPFGVPEGPDLPERLGGVLAVIYLIFNEGYSASSGDALIRGGLCEEAIFLARMLNGLRPGEPEIEGLLSLLLTTDARRAARTGGDGGIVPLDVQDRAAWDRARIAEGLALIAHGVPPALRGPYRIKAEIGALIVGPDRHADIDWGAMVAAHDALMAVEPTPVVALNRAVAIAEAGMPAEGLATVEALAGELGGYQPFHAVRADLLARAGRRAEAAAAYDTAIALSGTQAERAFLEGRRALLG
jgi:RNA polymerase sigma-70 factor (ECF subfamily)